MKEVQKLEAKKRTLLVEKSKVYLDIVEKIEISEDNETPPLYEKLGKITFQIYILERKINRLTKNTLEET